MEDSILARKLKCDVEPALTGKAVFLTVLVQ